MVAGCGTRRFKLGTSRACCAVATPPGIDCPFTDVCNAYVASATATEPSLSIADGIITAGTPDATQFVPTTVSQKMKVDFQNVGTPINRLAELFIQPPATFQTGTPNCGRNTFGYLIRFSIGEFWGIGGSIGWELEATGDFGSDIQGNDTLAYVAGAEMEQRFTLSGGQYLMEWYYNSVLLYSVTRPIEWYDPFYHSGSIGFAETGDVLEDYELDIQPCTACDGDLLGPIGQHEYWYPTVGNTDGVAQINSPANDLPSFGTMTSVPGGINGNQWEFNVLPATSYLVRDYPYIMVDLSRDFTLSLWFEDIGGGQTASMAVGNMGASTIDLRDDYLVLRGTRTAPNLAANTEIQVFGKCGNYSETVLHSNVPVITGRSMHVARWTADTRTWKLYVGDAETGTVESTEFVKTTLLIPNSSSTQRLVLNFDGQIHRLDQPAIWPCALTDTQVNNLWNAGAGAVMPPMCQGAIAEWQNAGNIEWQNAGNMEWIN